MRIPDEQLDLFGPYRRALLVRQPIDIVGVQQRDHFRPHDDRHNQPGLPGLDTRVGVVQKGRDSRRLAALHGLGQRPGVCQWRIHGCAARRETKMAPHPEQVAVDNQDGDT